METGSDLWILLESLIQLSIEEAHFRLVLCAFRNEVQGDQRH